MVALAASHGTAFTCYEGDNWMQCANMGAVAATNDIGPNPRYMFETRNVLDISLRVVALTVLAVDVILFVYSFYPRRHSPSAILIATMLFLQVIGVLCQFITKVDLCPPALLSAHIYVAVACMMVSAELYNWVIYLRFTLVTSLSGWFRWLASAFLMLETTASIVAYGVTAYGYATQGRFGVDRSLGTSIYSIVAICQAFYALALSAHFIFTFYIPVIRLYRPDVPMLALVMNDGLAYIIAECLLHCVFTIAYYFERRYYSSGSQLASSLRYGLFLLFIRRMRMTIRQKDTDQSCHWPTADDVDPHPGHGHLHLHYDADDTGSPRPRRGSHDTDSTTPVAYVANSVGGGGVTTSTHGTIHRDLPNEVRRIGGFGSGIASPLVSGISGTGGTSGRGATGTTSGIASGIASGAAGHRWSLGHGAPYKPEMVWPAPFGPDCAPAKSVAGDWVARAMAARAAMLQAADVAAAAAALTPNPDGAAVAAAAAAAAPGLRDPLDGLRPPSPWSRIGSGPGGRAVDAAVAVPVEGMSSVVYNPKTGPAAPATLGGLAGRRSPTPPTSPPPPPVPTLLGGEGLPPCLAFVQAPLAPRPPPAAPASSDPPPGSTSPATAPDPLHGRPADPTAATTMIPLAAATPVASLSFGYDLVAPLTAEDHGFPLSSTIRDHAWGPQPQPPPLSGTAAPAAAAAGVDAGAAAGAGAGASADADLARTRRSWGSAVGRRLSALSAPSEPESDAATGHGPPRGHDPSAGLRIDGAGASNAPADTFAWAPSPSPSLGGLLWSSSASPTPSARPLGPSSGVGGGGSGGGSNSTGPASAADAPSLSLSITASLADRDGLLAPTPSLRAAFGAVSAAPAALPMSVAATRPVPVPVPVPRRAQRDSAALESTFGPRRASSLFQQSYDGADHAAAERRSSARSGAHVAAAPAGLWAVPVTSASATVATAATATAGSSAASPAPWGRDGHTRASVGNGSWVSGQGAAPPVLPLDWDAMDAGVAPSGRIVMPEDAGRASDADADGSEDGGSESVSIDIDELEALTNLPAPLALYALQGSV